MTTYDRLRDPARLKRPLGLALSGGGFRAMLFHVGAIVRLNELGLLRSVDEISGVSGGAIVAGRLGVSWPRLTFRLGRATNLWEEVVAPLLTFSSRRIDVRAVTRALVPGASAAREVERAYRDHVVGDAVLGDLVDRPRISFLAVDLATGAPWSFDREGATSPPIGRLSDPAIPLARAMAASSAYPPFLAPLVLHVDPRRLPADRSETRVVLADGGLHDNLGLVGMWDRCATVLSSDAGGALALRPRPSSFWLRQLVRSIELHADRSRALQRHAALADLRQGRKTGTLWRIDTQLSRYPVEAAFHVDPSWPPYLAGMRTRLDRFSITEQCLLVNWGYIVADVAMRAHVLDAPRPSRLPFPRLSFLLPAPGAAPEEWPGLERTARNPARRPVSPRPAAGSAPAFGSSGLNTDGSDPA